jgi:sirohydrochlorin ferrochelatase
MSDRTPVLVGCSHGTDDPEGRALVTGLLADVRGRRPDLDVREAFVDVQQPEVAQVVTGALDDAGSAVVVPLLLSAGFHVHVDIAQAVDVPGAVASAALGPDDRLVAILVDRLVAAGAAAGDAVVLAAAGSSDPRARTAVEDLLDRLRVAWPVGPVTLGYCSAAQPAVADAVVTARSALAAAGAHDRRVVVLAYLLAPGFFLRRLHGAGADVVTAPLLPDGRVAEVVLDRYAQACPAHGEPATARRPRTATVAPRAAG